MIVVLHEQSINLNCLGKKHSSVLDMALIPSRI